MEIKKVGVLGCGLMGAGIAQTAASAGFETTVREVSEELIQKGLISKEDGMSFLRRRSGGKQVSNPPPQASRLPTSPAIN